MMEKGEAPTQQMNFMDGDSIKSHRVISDDSPVYYSENEVALHMISTDAWVSIFGKVFDITPVIQEHKGLLTKPLSKFAGQDISHWFDPKTQQVKTFIDPVSGIERPYTPYGRFVHVPPNEPTSSWATDFDIPWWQDEQYIIGNLTKKSRKLRIQNVLTEDEHTLEVCSEETLEEIRTRYLDYNAHAESYTWKQLGRPLDMSKTLESNGIPDEAEDCFKLGIDEDDYIPCIQIYFDDDMTIA